MILKAWISLFGDGRAVIRGLSVLFGALSVVPLYFIVLRWTGRRIALLSALFLAVNPINIQFSRELRNYSLVSFLLISAIFFFVEICNERRWLGRRVNVLLFALFLALCFYTHYISVLFFGLFGIAATMLFLEERDGSAFKAQCAGLVIAGLLCIPQSVHMLGYSLGAGAERNDWIPKTTWTAFYHQTLGAYPFPAMLKPVMAALYGFGAWQLYRRSRFLFIVAAVFTVLALVLCAFLGIFKGIYLVRTIQCFVLMSGVFLACAISSLPPRKMALSAVLLVAINLWSARANYPADRIAEPGLVLKRDLLDQRPASVFFDSDLEYYMRAVRVDVGGWHGLFLTKVAEGSAQVDGHLVRCHRERRSCGTTALIIAVSPAFFADDARLWNRRADAWKQAYGARFDKVADGYRLVVFN